MQIFAGRYRVISQLAEGGMGVVFVAQHTTTEERVALKVMVPRLVRVDGARKKFELEAKIWARTKSEHIVRMLDAGIDGETGLPFLVMELLQGQTLAARVDQGGPVSWFEAVELMTQVARGLDAAHRHENAEGAPQPIVHRDLKPENLFLAARADGAALVKILDFGIAKVMSESTALSDDVRGTPLFMAFEQLVGDDPSARTDVWALGLITYYALTGHHYWRSGAASHREAQALFAEILQLPLPLPSARVREDGIDVRLPNGFDTWLLTCVARNPSRRFQSAGHAVDALRSLGGSRHERALSSTLSGPRPRPRPPSDAQGTAAGLAPLQAETLHPVSGDGRRELRAPSAARIGGALLLALGLVWSGYRLRGSTSASLQPEVASQAISSLAPTVDADSGSAIGGASSSAKGGVTSGDGPDIDANPDAGWARPQIENKPKDRRADAKSVTHKPAPVPLPPPLVTDPPQPAVQPDLTADDTIDDTGKSTVTGTLDPILTPRRVVGKRPDPWKDLDRMDRK